MLYKFASVLSAKSLTKSFPFKYSIIDPSKISLYINYSLVLRKCQLYIIEVIDMSFGELLRNLRKDTDEKQRDAVKLLFEKE